MTAGAAPPELRRVALVTGASRGIGAATAVQLARSGYDLVLAARTAKGLDDTAAEVRAAGGAAAVVPTDLTATNELDALAAEVGDRHGRLDVLVNNAGVLPDAIRTERVSREQWDQVVDLNLSAPWYLACRARKLMVASRQEGEAAGVIVNIASTAGFYPSRGLVA